MRKLLKPPRKKGKGNRKSAHTSEDAKALALAYKEISEDPAKATFRSSKEFWAAVTVRYAEIAGKDPETITPNAIGVQWSRMQSDMVIFTGCLARRQRLVPSGTNIEDDYNSAMASFDAAKNGKDSEVNEQFKYLEAWLLVKDMAKFDPAKFTDDAVLAPTLARDPAKNKGKKDKKEKKEKKKLTPSKAIKKLKSESLAELETKVVGLVDKLATISSASVVSAPEQNADALLKTLILKEKLWAINPAAYPEAESERARLKQLILDAETKTLTVQASQD